MKYCNNYQVFIYIRYLTLRCWIRALCKFRDMICDQLQWQFNKEWRRIAQRTSWFPLRLSSPKILKTPFQNDNRIWKRSKPKYSLNWALKTTPLKQQIPPNPFTFANKENLFHNNNQCLGPVQDIGADVKRHPTVKIKQD